jgi:hypothetical protein
VTELSEEQIEDTNTDGLDMTSALAEISEGLFGQESEGDPAGGEPKVEGEQTPAPKEEPAPPQAEEPKPEENSQEVQDVGAPKTWTKEEIAHWATVPEGAKAAILRREQDMFRGLEQYKEKADLGSKYDAVVEPFRAQLVAEQVDPVQLFQSFSGNHYLLSRGTPEQKLEVAANLVRSYGLDIDAIKARLGDAPPALAPEVLELRERLAKIEGTEQQRQQALMEEKKAEFSRQVEAFSSDPKNTYFNEVASDIAHFLKTGAATSLQAAYDLAVKNNPATWQKELDRITAERMTDAARVEEERVAAANKAKGANVKSKQKTADGTVPVGTLDETLNETMAAIKSRS